MKVPMDFTGPPKPHRLMSPSPLTLVSPSTGGWLASVTYLPKSNAVFLSLLKKCFFSSALVAVFFCQLPHSVAGMFYYGSEIAIDQGGAIQYFDAQGNLSSNPEWNGFNLGSYNLLGGSSLSLRGGGVFVFRDNGSDYINTSNTQTLFYSVYQGATAGTFTAAQLLAGSGGGTTAFLGGSNFQGYNFGLNTNLGTSFNTSGSWNIAVYFQGNASYNDNGQQFFAMNNSSNNGGANFVANISAFYGATTTGTQPSAFTGSGNFNFNGNGQTYTLNVANNYSGETQIDAGTVAVTGEGTLGSSTVYIGNGGNAFNAQLTLNGTVATLSNNIVSNPSTASGTRIIRKEGSTEQTLTGSITLSRNLQISVGSGSSLIVSGLINTNTLTLDKFGSGNLTLSNGSNNGLNRYYLSAGTVNVSGEGNLGSRAGAGFGNKLYFDGGALNATSGFTISGNNGITLGNSGGRISVASGQTLTVQSFIDDNNTTNDFIKSGAGTLFLDKSGVNDFSHTTIRVYEGTLSTWNPGGLLSSTVQLGDTITSGTYRFTKTDGSEIANKTFNIAAGGGSIRVTDDSLSLGTGNLTGSGTFSKIGNGTLTISGLSNSHNGEVLVSAGSLALTSSISSSALTLSGGNLSTSANNQLNDSATVTVNSGTFSVGGAETVGAISGSGGTINLGANTLTSSVAAGSSTFSGSITGTGGGITKSGAGELILAGSSNYTGATSVSQGTLRVNGSLGNTAVSVANGATLGGNATIGGLVTLNSGANLAPGNSVGVMNFSSGLTLNASSTVTMEISNVNGNADSINVTGGSLTYAGNLVFDAESMSGVTNNSYTLFTGSQTGSWSSVALASGPSPGFANNSGIWTRNAGDGNVWTYNQAAGTLTVIPEPSTYALMGIGAAFVLWRLRRRKHD
ncbi:MAG: autotransporter-associated beta strand repeat-containing protein [Verrucomicrobia bacterium]|nr:autotransporter-associated beta strand repeat-containing protein [Verrucomicrobiota bacterium]